MSTAAQIEANRINAESSTGPNTEAGKATSSQNAVAHGLFTIHDFIRPGEEGLHDELIETVYGQFAPVGLLECRLVDEIVRAMWRLRRCGQVEESFVNVLATESGPIPDPIQNEATARLQNSVDRARAQAHRLLNRCTKELRCLQTERHYRNEVLEAGTDITDLGVCDFRVIHKAGSESRRAALRQRRQELHDEVEGLMLADSPPEADADFPKMPLTERTQSAGTHTVEIARNAPCPCNFRTEIQALLRRGRPGAAKRGLSKVTRNS
jgi:hypothetical protein